MDDLPEFLEPFVDMTYLGDGAYVGRDRHDPQQFWIFTTDGNRVLNQVALDHAGLRALLIYTGQRTI